MSEVRITSTELGDAATSATGGQVQVTSYDGGNGIVQSVVAGTNVTVDSTDPAHPIVSASGGGGGGGAVASVNGHTGVVVLAAADVGADASGAASSAQTAAESYTDTAVAGEVARADGAYDALGAAAAAQAAAVAAAATDATTKADAAAAASQPLDSDLTAIALLSTTTFGRALLALADAAALRTAAGLGTAAVAASTDFDAVGAAAAAQAASQPLDSDLTAIAALSTTTYGRSLLVSADAAALRTAAGLGTAATQASTAFDASGAAAAAQAASQPIDSDLTAIAALGTTTFGRSFLALADAAAGRTLLGLGTLAIQSGTFSGTSSGTNTGDQTVTLTGDVTGSGTGSFAATLASTAVTPGSYGDASHSLAATVDAKGRLTALAANSIAIAASQVTSGVLAIGRLATGTPDGTKFVRDDGTLALPAGGAPSGAAGGDLAGTYPNPTLAVDRIATSIGTTKGDQIGFTGSGVPVRHAIGADGTVQTADSTQADGWKWSAPSGVPINYQAPSGALYETWERGRAGSSTNTVTMGTLYLFGISLPAGTSIGHLSFFSSTSVSSPTHWWFTLHDSSRVLLARTADQLTTAWSAGTIPSLAVAQVAAGAASSFTTTYTGLHYLGIMMAATSGLTLAGIGVTAALSGIAPIVCGTSNTGQTTPPSFPFTATAITAISTSAYGYVAA